MNQIKLFINILILSAVFLLSTSYAGKLYRWVDKQGNLHFTDSPAAIPDEYKDKVEINVLRDQEKKPAIPKPSSGKEKTTDMSSTPLPVTDNSLKKYEVKYKSHEGRSKRIIVPVIFNGSVTAYMAIDTGAPDMVISYALAERLGILSHDEGRLIIVTGGIGGSVPAIRTMVDSIAVGGAKDVFVPTTVTDPISDAFDGLIGMDFLSKYSIEIDTDRHIILFQEKPPSDIKPGGHNEEWWRNKFDEFAGYKNSWESFIYTLDKKLNEPVRSEQILLDLKKFAIRQKEEAEKLYFKLESYAIDNNVPMSWREY